MDGHLRVEVEHQRLHVDRGLCQTHLELLELLAELEDDLADGVTDLNFVKVHYLAISLELQVKDL
jgi:hypothetical protein